LSATAELIELFERVICLHPEFVAGAIYVRNDVVAAYFDVPVHEITPEQIAQLDDDDFGEAAWAIGIRLVDYGRAYEAEIRDAIDSDRKNRAAKS
jgi:hypothetical protein